MEPQALASDGDWPCPLLVCGEILQRREIFRHRACQGLTLLLMLQGWLLLLLLLLVSLLLLLPEDDCPCG